MAEGSKRLLPKWLAIGDDDKKITSKENRLRQEPEEKETKRKRTLAEKETKRKRDRHSESPDTAVSVSRGNKRKRKAGNSGFGTKEETDALTPTHDRILDDLTVDDLVGIAQEYVKENEDSEQNLLSSRNGQGQPSSSNEQQFSSHASIGSTINSTAIDFHWTDDPARDMLHLFLGPLL